MSFVGRSRELQELDRQLAAVRAGRRAGRGVAVLVRGRRRVGKSRLVEEFARRSGLDVVHFQAARYAPAAQEYDEIVRAVVDSGLPDAALAADSRPATLTAALTLLSAALPDDRPTIVVLDELPWLLEGVPGAAGELQRVWDTRLSRKPVLLLLVGSDLATMETLTAADQPFHGRATELLVDPLTPADVAQMSGLTGADAFDAYLVTGGLPLVVQEWERGWSLPEFLESSFAASTSALVVAGARALDGEVPESSHPRQVLTAIGARGERTYTGIRNAGAQPMNATTLTASLEALVARRLVAADEPLSTRYAHRDRRYRIADPGLRFWLAFVEPALSEVDRGRPDLATARVRAGFAAWRGRAVEPVVRDALARLLPDERWPRVARVGGWWPRTNVPEIDLTAVDRARSTLELVGTVKWRRDAPLTADEVVALASSATAVPGAGLTTPLVAVCPAGVADGVAGLAQSWTADDLLGAWDVTGDSAATGRGVPARR